MKKITKCAIGFLFLGLLSSSCFSQQNRLGVELNGGLYGLTTKNYYYQTFGKVEQEGSSIGLGTFYERRLQSSYQETRFFDLHAGLSFYRLKQDQYQMQVVRIPLNVSFSKGKIWKFNVGMGTFIDLMTSHEGWEEIEDFRETNHAFRLGLSTQLGVVYQSKENREFRLLVQRFSDITSVFENYTLTQISEPTLISKSIGVGTVVSIQYVIGL